ncbi:glycogen debranching enzyme [Tieghemostelium lacteum]|uniref:Glycogen debranching enzyme n=1 Tax=Tieghemostelium lacteum TaxID=361077 RepID=A0A152A9F1_TIELA|nr:glycogen debranching enzyme [Tieghemostelium lacteum]|eukprot:KYR02849.1 glycogen debranching enzyme [Tieghemostelium lacteum]
MIDNENNSSSHSNEFKSVLESFDSKIRMKDYSSSLNSPSKENVSGIDTNVGDAIYTITMSGNGSEPPFNQKGLILKSLGTLRIIIPAGFEISSKNPQIYTNYPEGPNDKFQRDHFTKFQKDSEHKIYNGNNDLYFDRKIERYGCFEYYVSWDEDIDPPIQLKAKVKGTFQVNPVLTINNNVLPSDGIILQTYLTKCLGPLENWDHFIQQSSQLGYNMIHFTPIQEIGASGSSYSIYDQQSISSKIHGGSEQEKLFAVKDFIIGIEKKYNVLSMIDLVWNHTAHNSKWLTEHPDAGYNTDNSPHLKSAVLLDQALVDYGKGIYGKEINDSAQLDELMSQIKERVILPLRLWEYYVLDIDSEIKRFKEQYQESGRVKDSIYASSAFSPSYLKNVISNPTVEKNDIIKNITKKGLIRNPSYERFSLGIDLAVVFKLLDTCSTFINLTTNEQAQWYQEVLNSINMTIYDDYDADYLAMCNNIYERLKYERLSSHGPKMGAFTSAKPMINSYFTKIPVRQQNGTIREIPLANNGWIYNYNPTVDFASSQSRSYLRRDVIVWGDCVKLRYGSQPSDSPWLWNHMKEYTQKMASIFQAIRIDNCHSTPIHVAQYLLDCAREVRPSLYVTCELFTGSEDVDDIFVRNLGINSLIREAMACHDSSELGRVCHRYGGLPICSLNNNFDSVQALLPVLPPALFMDCTHDNETPFQKRTVFDTLPNSAVVAMTISAIGSTKGYDENYSKTVDLVNETKKYQPDISLNSGIFPVRKLLNKVHLELSYNKYNEIHVSQYGNVILVQRYSPSINESLFCLAHSSFSLPKQDVEHDDKKNSSVKGATFSIPCEINEFLFGARITGYSGSPTSEGHLNGLQVECEQLFGDKVLNRWCQIETPYSNESQLKLKLIDFPPGSVLFFRGKIPKDSSEAMEKLDALLSDQQAIQQSIQSCKFLDFNILLYRYHEEEKSITGSGSYHLDGYGQLPFCGLQGFITLLNHIYKFNDLGHPLCNNLRNGNWVMDYITGRLSQRQNLLAGRDWFIGAFNLVKQLPRHFIPKYFNMVVFTFYKQARKYIIQNMMPKFISTGNELTQDLAMASLQFYGLSTPLISNPNVLEGVPDREASMAAGFPHFSTGYMRSWGRDTFISLRGILLVTGRIQEAKQLIIGFGSCLRFGLIPNLLDSGTKPRFNSRDSVWWYLRSILDLYQILKNDNEKKDLLSSKVYRLFPQNSNEPFSTISEMIQEILQAHASGIDFREPNAGREIDEKMRDEGFNIKIHLNKDNGFLYGGNPLNCGTWMDKMGESQKANNFGEPATPRDGAPIEITAMLYSIVSWLSDLNQKKLYPHTGVKLADGSTLSYDSWSKLIQQNFEKYYYVPAHGCDKGYLINVNYIRRRSIYKDVVGSKSQFSDYQFRPNLCVAMSFAPELFQKEHAIKCLELVRTSLLGPLGMKTLDPNDPTYHGNYDNSNDNAYKPTAKGFNYHNGPEWVWCYGFFLNALINFSVTKSAVEKNHLVESLLLKHRSYITTSPYASLPELTNRDGAYCRDSCESQAWSIATILSSIQKL